MSTDDDHEQNDKQDNKVQQFPSDTGKIRTQISRQLKEQATKEWQQKIKAKTDEVYKAQRVFHRAQDELAALYEEVALDLKRFD